ncbi:MAG: type II toxin-antitoxin system VapC family toxin [Novosphingobium sp.]|uniref:type II toxin-antitoxin system VapC family toxin n=1 Tax=Novosphingobium sp. TaxID=1874826 RepID=UPI0032BC63A9
MIYCDTSLCVAGLSNEPMAGAVQAWLADQEADALCISAWGVTEFSSAVSLKLRRGEIDPPAKAQMLSNWQIVQRDHLTAVTVSDQAFALAARFCDRADLGIRAGDALHLAVASLGGHRLATLDRQLAAAALAVGVEVTGPAPA